MFINWSFHNCFSSFNLFLFVVNALDFSDDIHFWFGDHCFKLFLGLLSGEINQLINLLSKDFDLVFHNELVFVEIWFDLLGETGMLSCTFIAINVGKITCEQETIEVIFSRILKNDLLIIELKHHIEFIVELASGYICIFSLHLKNVFIRLRNIWDHEITENNEKQEHSKEPWKPNSTFHHSWCHLMSFKVWNIP